MCSKSKPTLVLIMEAKAVEMSELHSVTEKHHYVIVTWSLEQMRVECNRMLALILEEAVVS
jgi:hypothetical protein